MGFRKWNLWISCLIAIAGAGVSSPGIALQAVTPVPAGSQGSDPGVAGQLIGQLEQYEALAERVRGDRHKSESALKALEDQSAALKEQIREALAAQDALNVSEGSFEEVQRFLQTQRVTLMIDLAGLDARQKTVLELSEQNARESEKRSGPIVAKLAELVELERKHYAQQAQLFEKGAQSRAVLDECEKAVIVAEIQWLQALQAANQTGPASVDPALAELTLSRAEKTARLAQTEELLKSLLPARVLMEQSAELKSREKLLEDKRQTASNRLQRLDAQMTQFEEKMQELRDQIGRDK